MLLYENLEINQNSQDEEIDRCYKSLAYKYKRTKNEQKMSELNKAYSIMKDKHKRDFYDRCLWILYPIEESFFISRIITSFNVSCFFLYFYMVSANFYLLGFIFRISCSNLLRFSLWILSPVPLILVYFKSRRDFSPTNRYFPKFVFMVNILIFNSVSLSIVLLRDWNALKIQKFTKFNIESMLILIFNELFLLIYCSNLRKVFDSSYLSVTKGYIRFYRFMILRCLLLLMYFLENNVINHVIPMLILACLAFFHPILGFTSVLVLPMTVAIMFKNTERIITLSNIIDFSHLIIWMIILYSVISNYRSLRVWEPINRHLGLKCISAAPACSIV